jgi:hypothetical protein
MTENQLLHKWLGGQSGEFIEKHGRDELLEMLNVIERRRGDRRCRECGCTDDNCHDCVVRTGAMCYWVEVDLCSACIPSGVSSGNGSNQSISGDKS